MQEDYENLVKESDEALESNTEHNIKEAIKTAAEEVSYDGARTAAQMERTTYQKETDEMIRARLRCFARTIPSFLMAYGDDKTELQNFDTIIKDADDFKELTGISS